MIDPDAVKRALRGGPVDDNTELAAAIGRCSNNWAHAESRLAIIFCLLSKTDLTTAVTILSFFKATRMQIDVLKRLGKISPLMTAQKSELLTDLMKEYQSLANERNQLLHNPIGMNEELYIMLRDKSPNPEGIPYKTEPISIEGIDDLSGLDFGFQFEGNYTEPSNQWNSSSRREPRLLIIQCDRQWLRSKPNPFAYCAMLGQREAICAQALSTSFNRCLIDLTPG